MKTIDKIKYILGNDLFTYISSLNYEELQKQKSALVYDNLMYESTYPELWGQMKFKRETELELINYLMS